MWLGERLAQLFPGSPPESLKALEAICELRSYARGDRLFEEGVESRGFFILLSGSAKLIVGSEEGKNYAVRSVKPGEVLGASSIISDSVHLVTAEIVEPSEVGFVARAAFLDFLTTVP